MKIRSQMKWGLVGGLIALLLMGMVAWLIPARLARAVEQLSQVPAPNWARDSQPAPLAGPDSMVEMSLEKVSLDSRDRQPVVMLREKGGERYLPVWIGMAEARAIAIALQGVTPPRPLTHDLLRAAFDAMGAQVRFILIEDLREGIFYAKVVLHLQGKRIELDSRPSDALALALRTGSPIYAREKLLERTPSPGDIKGKTT